MLKRAARKAVWVAKGAALFWGAALTLALVLGVGTVALAAAPGDPFRLGQTNTISNAFTKIVGFNPGDAVLKVDNDSSAGGSRALDLRVEPGKQPINVNTDAGKATGLDADEVDGKGAAQIGVNGLEKVQDVSAFDSASPKSAQALCPPGKVVVAAGYGLTGASTGSAPDQQTEVVVTETTFQNDGIQNPTVFVTAREVEAFAGNWLVRADALCATEGTP